MESFTLVDKTNMDKLVKKSKKVRMRRKKYMKKAQMKNSKKKMKRIKKKEAIYSWHQI